MPDPQFSPLRLRKNEIYPVQKIVTSFETSQNARVVRLMDNEGGVMMELIVTPAGFTRESFRVRTESNQFELQYKYIDLKQLKEEYFNKRWLGFFASEKQRRWCLLDESGDMIAHREPIFHNYDTTCFEALVIEGQQELYPFGRWIELPGVVTFDGTRVTVHVCEPSVLKRPRSVLMISSASREIGKFVTVQKDHKLLPYMLPFFLEAFYWGSNSFRG